MTKEQREIISDFLKSILDSGEKGDFLNVYNNSTRLVKDLSGTDEKLKIQCKKVEEDFENPF